MRVLGRHPRLGGGSHRLGGERLHSICDGICDGGDRGRVYLTGVQLLDFDDVPEVADQVAMMKKALMGLQDVAAGKNKVGLRTKLWKKFLGFIRWFR